MSLYHAYRPQTFADIVGQDHIKATLAAAVARGEVAHAYLFSGPRGIGKTSIARILAMAVNCAQRTVEKSEARSQKLEDKGLSKVKSQKSKVGSAEPCGECSSCLAVRTGNDLNVIEIDAASNRGIDEIRQLKENIGFAPSQQAHKVYIIDEVHMLTKEAFNALLKTLEEPPVHAIFILATTELHRVPDTIISRTQHFSFKRATLADTRTHLGMIAGKEGLKLSSEATELIALHADGAFRDALSLLDQLAALGEKEITAEHVRLLLGIAPEAELLELLTASLAGDPAGVHTTLTRFGENGYDPAALADALITTLRHVLWAHYGLKSEGSELLADFASKQAKQQSPATLIRSIERLIVAKQQLRWSPLPMLPLELALLGESRDSSHEIRAVAPTSSSVIARPRSESGAKQSGLVETTIPLLTKNPPQPSSAKGGSDENLLFRKEGLGEISADTTEILDPRQVGVKNDGQSEILKQVQDDEVSKVKGQRSKVESGDIAGIWTKVLTKIRPKNAQLAALLKSSKLLAIEDGQCRIEVPFSFYADRIKDHKNAAIITEAIEAETGLETVVRCVVAGTQTTDVRRQTSGEESNVKGQMSKVEARTQDDVAKDVMEIFGTSEATAVPVGEEVHSG